MRQSAVHRILAAALTVGIGLAVFGGASARQTPPTKPTPPKTEPKHVNIGDVQISGYTLLKTSPGFKGVHLTGPKTLIVVPDKKTNSTLRLHADDIQTQTEKGDTFAVVEMRGNVRYTITRQTEKGTSAVEGTAEQGAFRRAARQMELSGGVRAVVTDAAHLSGPTVIRAARVSADLAASPIRYEVSGPAETNDIRFTPRPPAPNPAGTTKRGVRVGEVHLYGYRTGTFQVGELARFDGPDSTVELRDSAGKTQARLQADRIEASFSPTGSALRQAEAVGSVRYRVERPAPSGTGAQVLTGSSERASYDAQADRIDVSGGVDARLTAPDTLQDPAHLTADRLTAMLTEPVRYTVSGVPNHTLIEFTPRQHVEKPPAPGKEPARRFVFGTLQVRRFESGTFAPGKEIAVTGSETLFESMNAQAHTSARLQADRVVATYGQDRRTIASAEAGQNVRFRVEQPSSSGKTQQIVHGNAARAVFTNTPESRQIQVIGPMRAEVIDSEHLAEPAHMVGFNDGDRLTVNLAAHDNAFEFESKMQTATLDFVPRDTSQDASKPKTPPAQKKKNGKQTPP